MKAGGHSKGFYTTVVSKVAHSMLLPVISELIVTLSLIKCEGSSYIPSMPRAVIDAVNNVPLLHIRLKMFSSVIKRCMDSNEP